MVLRDLTVVIARKINLFLIPVKERHLVDIEERSIESSINEDPELSLIKSESVQNLVDGYKKPKNIAKCGKSLLEELSMEKFAYKDGFSLHVKVKNLGHQRSALERPCSYVSSGSITENRVSLTAGGAVRLEPKKAIQTE